MALRLGSSFRVGLGRRWRSASTAAFGFVGGLWTVSELLSAIFDEVKKFLIDHHFLYLGFVLLGAATIFVRAIYERTSISFRVPRTESNITIKFGDLFAEDADLLIAVNDTFDSRLGQIVSPQSVHGGFIQRFYKSDEDAFAAAIAAQLSQVPGELASRAYAPDALKYPIGTTATVHLGSRRAHLFAFTHTDSETAKAYATVPMLWQALTGALRVVHNVGNGEPIALPLVGNGRSGLNIRPQHLLRLIVLILVEFSKLGLPNSTTIVVPWACFDSLDLKEIAEDWKRG